MGWDREVALRGGGTRTSLSCIPVRPPEWDGEVALRGGGTVIAVGRRRLQAMGAAAGLLVLVVVALVRLRPRESVPVPPGLVPPTWTEVRLSPGHRAHVERAKIACGSCHDFERDGFKNPGTGVCARCHAKEVSFAHRGGPGAEATSCLSCHAFAPDRPEPKCIDCHARGQDGAAAIVQHAAADCARCHRVHDSPSTAVAECTGCHEERAAEHERHAGSNGCRDCHRVHEPAAAALQACPTCHAQPAGPRPAGHESCVGCHAPHSFVAGGSNACLRCHGNKPTLAAAFVPAHGMCTSCHAPHAPGEAATSCIGCHDDVRVEHGSRDACVTCHTPHGENPNVPATACTRCHTRLPAPEAAADARGMAFVPTSDTSAHAGGTACVTCHIPHEFLPESPQVACTRCHARETSLVATRAGHQNCSDCHGALVAHAPAKAPACGTCHRAEQASAPIGHATCVGCHDPHAGQPTPACASCHRNEASGAHESIQGGCETCHRPHGPQGPASPPLCTSCHARSSLPALHAASGHAECTKCHVTPHAPARDDRATCTGCHSDRRDHQPQAAVCRGCHVFRK